MRAYTTHFSGELAFVRQDQIGDFTEEHIIEGLSDNKTKVRGAIMDILSHKKIKMEVLWTYPPTLAEYLPVYLKGYRKDLYKKYKILMKSSIKTAD